MRKSSLIRSLMLCLPILSGPRLAETTLPMDLIRLPADFHISLFADQLPNARSLALGANGTVFVGSRSAGNVYALRDSNGDGRADLRYTIARDLNSPNGVAFRNGSLYVAETSRILRFDNIESTLAQPDRPHVLIDDLPDDSHHGWRYISFGPDDHLYVSIGAPCNVCDSPDHGMILRMKADGSEREIFARGVRNSVGFDWHPQTGTFWFTDNGRDHLGDDLPPDEINRADRQGLHFGFPYCHGSLVADPQYGRSRSCAVFEAPAWELAAHVAPLGLRFYTGTQFPESYRNQIFVAEHGSWNRKKKTGYRVIRLILENGQVTGQELFATGWLQGEQAWGRPVALLVMRNGDLLVSDDSQGVVYRIFYHPETKTAPQKPSPP